MGKKIFFHPKTWVNPLTTGDLPILEPLGRLYTTYYYRVIWRWILSWPWTV